jgi:hypothetical protein
MIEHDAGTAGAYLSPEAIRYSKVFAYYGYSDTDAAMQAADDADGMVAAGLSVRRALLLAAQMAEVFDTIALEELLAQRTSSPREEYERTADLRRRVRDMTALRVMVRDLAASGDDRGLPL